ncbi:MAG TPA: hypothetical protein VGQ39_23325 [Pyrinomonadaceae bacterium]|jgi:hypothetical protein|nr:hypothetical protein [Pyrinomonadaceae bacterium]
MNEEYLWDKSGEPDPEIQQLEQILGTLRYQPKALELPNDIQVVRRNRYLPLVAIAATILVALLVAILWFSLQNRHTDLPQQAIVSPTIPSAPTPIVPGLEKKEEVVKSPSIDRHREIVAHNSPRRTRSEPAAPSKEALLVKEQLMTALRLASEKLNLAQRKAQGPAPNQIRNQHKVG